MKNINEYLEDKIITDPVNEGILDSLFNFFKKVFVKKYKISSNSSDVLSETLAANKKELDEEVKKLSTKVRVKDAEDWWKRFSTSDENKSAKLTDPKVYNKNLLQNIQLANKIFTEEIKQYTQKVNCINNAIIQNFLLRDVKDLTALISIVNEENEKMVPKNQTIIKQVLGTFKKIEKLVTDKEAKEVYDNIIKTLEDSLK